jgi:hypothetical protein
MNKPITDTSKPERYEQLKQERRFITVPVDMNTVGEMFLRSDMRYTFDGLPDDAIFVHADRDIQTQCFDFIYLHESFAPVPQGVRPPMQWLTVHQAPTEKDS